MARKKKRPTKSRQPERDARGYIVKSMHPPDHPDYFERGRLEGQDALSLVPREHLQALSDALKSGEADIDISPDEDGWVVDVSIGRK